jgi:hypothetical protein
MSVAITRMHFLSTAFLLLGLVMTVVGAYVASDAVVVTEDQATDIARTDWHSLPLRRALLDQSRMARNGLRLVMAGAVLQAIGTVLALF